MSTSSRLFGTDGVRGTANQFPMTIEMAMKLAQAAGAMFRRGNHRHRVVIGKDTRLSGYMLEPALASGFVSMGMDVVMTGPLPTPAIARLVRSMRADLGVMLSASHNPYQDNGIKFFGPDGFKLSDVDELTLEEMATQKDLSSYLAAPDKLGKAQRLDDCQGRYTEAAKSTFPKGMRLDGLKIVLDCANGAAYKVAPQVLWELGAEVISIAVSPNGTNINASCGATHPAGLQAKVLETGADIGIALDGDADRIIVVDEKGHVIDGDQMLALAAHLGLQQETIKGGGIVGTVMSNLGLERYLNAKNLTLHRTPVGDRYVVAAMRAYGMNVGGEQSGHMVFLDHSTTGDGLVGGLQVLAALVAAQKPASEVCHLFTSVPQKLKNIRCGNPKVILANQQVQAQILDTEKKLQGKGRLLVRKSGTEPLIRIMVESEDEVLLMQSIDAVEQVMRAAER
jgi:phosphoglucosamine mutase